MMFMVLQGDGTKHFDGYTFLLWFLLDLSCIQFNKTIHDDDKGFNVVFLTRLLYEINQTHFYYLVSSL